MTESEVDTRPALAIGHIGPHPVGDLSIATKFYVALGCRPVAEMETLAVLELRGGTHLILKATDSGEAGRAPFDLMVDDIDDAHARFSSLNFAPTSISRGNIHDHFTVTDPAGWVVTITSSHAMGVV